MRPPPVLSRGTLDRATVHRTDEAWLAQAWGTAAVLVLAPDATVAVDAADPRLLFEDPTRVPPHGVRFFLGVGDDGLAYFAVVAATEPPGPRSGLREVGALLSDRDAGLLVAAVALANWHRTHTNCPRCGTRTEPAAGGWQRRCPADGSDHFPRVDPAVIMLVHDGADRCLLGRQASWPPDRFSTLAGFVEPGESAEQAVVREVAEETGIAVRDVLYRGSQPWPFPASLMLGYRAVCDAGASPVPADGELEDARWFDKDALRAGGSLLLPTPVSIAWHLITDWLDEV